jgi:hypothetical protein
MGQGISTRLIIPRKTQNPVAQPDYNTDMLAIERWSETAMLGLVDGTNTTVVNEGNGIWQVNATGGGGFPPAMTYGSNMNSAIGSPGNTITVGFGSFTGFNPIGASGGASNFYGVAGVGGASPVSDWWLVQFTWVCFFHATSISTLPAYMSMACSPPYFFGSALNIATNDSIYVPTGITSVPSWEKTMHWELVVASGTNFIGGGGAQIVFTNLLSLVTPPPLGLVYTIAAEAYMTLMPLSP